MTNKEFSNEFDILYNNIASNQAPGLTEYEKSVFLTNAQEALILGLFSGKNIFGYSFEETEEIRQYLSDIVKTAELSISSNNGIIKISNNSTIYDVPEDLWFITYESVKFKNSPECNCFLDKEVIPITQDEFSRIRKNPFRKANINRVLRLNVSGKLELISVNPIQSYTIRYITTLSPIILEDLPLGLTIKGESKETHCKLNPAIHRAILDNAVQLAKVSMGLINSGEQINQTN